MSVARSKPVAPAAPPPASPWQDALVDAAASLAPVTTPHGHRPDWQMDLDDEAASRRDDDLGG